MSSTNDNKLAAILSDLETIHNWRKSLIERIEFWKKEVEKIDHLEARINKLQIDRKEHPEKVHEDIQKIDEEIEELGMDLDAKFSPISKDKIKMDLQDLKSQVDSLEADLPIEPLEEARDYKIIFPDESLDKMSRIISELATALKETQSTEFMTVRQPTSKKVRGRIDKYYVVKRFLIGVIKSTKTPVSRQDIQALINSAYMLISKKFKIPIDQIKLTRGEETRLINELLALKSKKFNN